MLLVCILFIPVMLMAEGSWPKEIRTANATIILYQPQPDSMRGDHLFTRSAVSLTVQPSETPVFGAVWADSRFSTDRESGLCSIYNVTILNVRFPGIDTVDPAKVERFRKVLEEAITDKNLSFALDELKSTLAINQAEVSASANLKNDPPEIIFTKEYSVLLLFDGNPVFKEVEKAVLNRAVNTPFLVLEDLKDKHYYLCGDDLWFRSTDPVKSEWAHIEAPPSQVAKYFSELKEQASNEDKETGKPDQDKPGTKPAKIPKIIVRTTPAELVQSRGEPEYALIEGTGLLYMNNTKDYVFMTVDDNLYYILISGRWYRSSSLSGPWTFVESDKLPPDFAKIPEGSEKDIVLASVAGTQAAKEAVMDAQIPQTAAVDRKTAKCEVKYDGEPAFEKIKGTELSRALNTGSTVLLFQQTYYVCDNAVWFSGKTPTGPWEVATYIPAEIQKIPPEDPSYNVKYVYIYDVQPEVVYMGYTPGYFGCYIYGPTIVYGTGWIYSPFYGPWYYPRPVTFGFHMSYNPWYGWSMGFSVSVGWFTFSIGGPFGYPGCWWGPPLYHPPYHPPYSHYYGPRQPVYRGGNNNIYINNSRNIYANRADGSARVSPRPEGSIRPVETSKAGARDLSGTDRISPQKNNVYTDHKGDIYRNNNGEWQKNNGKDWNAIQPAQQNRSAPSGTQTRSGSSQHQEMQLQNTARDRGTQNMMNRSSFQRSFPGQGGGGVQMGGGGGIRRP